MRMLRPSVLWMGFLSSRSQGAAGMNPGGFFPSSFPPPAPILTVLSQEKRRSRAKPEGHAWALLAPQAVAEPEVGRGACPPEPTGPPITHPRRPFEPGQEFEPQS